MNGARKLEKVDKKTSAKDIDQTTSGGNKESKVEKPEIVALPPSRNTKVGEESESVDLDHDLTDQDMLKET